MTKIKNCDSGGVAIIPSNNITLSLNHLITLSYLVKTIFVVTLFSSVVNAAI